MTFIADPKNVHRVFAPESGFDLTRVFRDVPKDGAWFRFLFEGTTFIVKLNVSWSNNGSKATYLLQVKQLADGSGCGSRPIVPMAIS
jgi:hypothetical protein